MGRVPVGIEQRNGHDLLIAELVGVGVAGGAGHERSGPVRSNVVKRRAVLAGDLDEVLESGIGEEGHESPPFLEECVGRCRGPVQKHRGADTGDSPGYTYRLIGRGRHFESTDGAFLDHYDIGEGATDVNPDEGTHYCCTLRTYYAAFMAVQAASTPNPNAFRFSVGAQVGGPGTYVKGSDVEEEYLARILELDGVASVFFTADFVTISKSPDGSWESITPQAVEILEAHFGA